LDIDSDVTSRAMYDRVCEAYHAIDEFRTKLLSLLPVATGTGVFLLLSGKADLLVTGVPTESKVPEALAAIGGFGFLFTLGLFAYELFGIKKCHYLIDAGERLESRLGVLGQFRSRPHALAGLINEPFASSIIYPASMAAWLFVGLIFNFGPIAAAVLAGVVVVIGCVGTIGGARLMKSNKICEDRIVEMLRHRGPMSLSDLQRELEPTFRRSGREPSPGKVRIRRVVCRLEKRGDIVDTGEKPSILDVDT
jgi:hypothetical protein